MTLQQSAREAGPPTAVRVARPRASDPGGSRVTEHLTTAVVVLVVLLIPLRVQLANGVTLGLLAGIALAPVWLGRLRAYRGGTTAVLLITGAMASGLWLTTLASVDHQIADHHIRMWVGLMLTFATTVGVVLWARQRLHIGTVAAIYGLGMLGSSVINGFSASNPWKGGYSLPLTVLLLGIAWRTGRRTLELVLALGLAAVSAMNDSRSHFAMVLLASAIVFWQMIPRAHTRRRRRSPFGATVVLVTIGVAIYSLGQALILEGHLGEATQARSQEQIARSGSILLGGRPEIGATQALVAHRPFGFGFGTKPTLEDINVAKTGMSRLGYDPDNGYVENYMFGDGIKLHSLVGDTWALFGLVGLAMTAFLTWALVRRLSVDLSTSTASALTAFLTARLLWDVGFGGFYGSLPILGLAIGVALLPRGHSRTRKASVAAPVAPGTGL